MRVLIVEDEPAIARVLFKKISNLNHEVQCVETVHEAREKIVSFDPEIIFLDYILKDGRSKELAVAGDLTKKHVIFLMSAFMDDLEKSDFSDLNVTYLKKPFESLSAVLDKI